MIELTRSDNRTMYVNEDLIYCVIEDNTNPDMCSVYSTDWEDEGMEVKHTAEVVSLRCVRAKVINKKEVDTYVDAMAVYDSRNKN